MSIGSLPNIVWWEHRLRCQWDNRTDVNVQSIERAAEQVQFIIQVRDIIKRLFTMQSEQHYAHQ